MNHVMLDIETLGKSNDAAVVSIGAVAFRPSTGEIDRENAFYIRIALERSGPNIGVMDASTIEWWLKQSKAAQDQLLAEPRVHAYAAASAFTRWARELQPSPDGVEYEDFQPDDGMRLWGNGPTFDEIITRSFVKRAGQEWPFHYRASRDYRTVKDLADQFGINVSVPFTGERHNALSDAIHQAEVVNAFYAGMRQYAVAPD